MIWPGRGTAIARPSARRSTACGAGRSTERYFATTPPRLAAETATGLGGRSQDHDPTTPAWPGGGGREPAEARVACVLAQGGIPGLDARPREDAASGLLCIRGGVDVSHRRSGIAARPGRATLPRAAFLLREPERSRRAIRLLFANWLAHAEAREPGPRKAAVTAFFRGANRTDSVLLYPVGPAAPDGARVLSPQEVASWLASAYDIKVIAWNRLWPSVRLREQAGYRELVVTLAKELYHRERGVSHPPTKPWSALIWRACPMTAWPNSTAKPPIAPDEPAPAQPPAK